MVLKESCEFNEKIFFGLKNNAKNLERYFFINCLIKKLNQAKIINN